MADYSKIKHLKDLNNSMFNERMNRAYDYGYEDGLARGTECGYKRGYQNGHKSAQIPLVTIKGEKYCRWDDVQNLWEQMKGEANE